MLSIEKRAELIDLLYSTIMRESSKKEENINTALVDKCFEFLEKLEALEEISLKRLEEIEKEISEKASGYKHRRKRVTVRLIAAIVTLFILMGMAVYTFYDEFEEVSKNTTPGYKYSSPTLDYEVSTTYDQYSTVKELFKEHNLTLYIPSYIPKEYKIDSCDYATYSAYNDVSLIWVSGEYSIIYNAKVDMDFSKTSIHIDEEAYNYISSDGIRYLTVFYDGKCEAQTIIDGVYYHIQTTDEDVFYDVINSMTLSK